MVVTPSMPISIKAQAWVTRLQWHPSLCLETPLPLRTEWMTYIFFRGSLGLLGDDYHIAFCLLRIWPEVQSPRPVLLLPELPQRTCLSSLASGDSEIWQYPARSLCFQTSTCECNDLTEGKVLVNFPTCFQHVQSHIVLSNACHNWNSLRLHHLALLVTCYQVLCLQVV